jgi:hypothetical protein
MPNFNNNIEIKEEKGAIYGNNAMIIVPQNKKNDFILSQKTMTLVEQKHIMDMLWCKYLSMLSGSEYKILFFILARTFGFNKLIEIINIKSIKNGFASKEGDLIQYGTNLSVRTIKRAIKSLVKKHYIIQYSRSSMRDGRRLASAYSINLTYFNAQVLHFHYNLSEDEIVRLLESDRIEKSRTLTEEDMAFLRDDTWGQQ